MSARPLRLTAHAAVRARERVGHAPALRRAVRLPKSAARRLTSWSSSRLRPGQELWCTSDTLLLVGSRRRVVTVVPLSIEDLATVLVLKLCDTWP